MEELEEWFLHVNHNILKCIFHKILYLYPGAKYLEYEVDTIENKNVVLHDLQDNTLVYKEYTKKINNVLHEMDASKLRTELTVIDKAASDQNIDHEKLEYFFGEVIVMAKENLDEVEKIRRGLKAISS